MTRFTGTADDFKRLAPQGLVLYVDDYGSHSFLFYEDGEYRFYRLSPSHPHNPPSRFIRAELVSHKIEVLSGAWRLFTYNNSDVRLYIMSRPTVYRRTICE